MESILHIPLLDVGGTSGENGQAGLLDAQCQTGTLTEFVEQLSVLIPSSGKQLIDVVIVIDKAPVTEYCEDFRSTAG